MKTFVALLFAVAAYGQADLSGVWIVSGNPDITGDIPYNSAATKIWQERKAKLKDQDPATYCLPNGAVRVTTLPYKIVQTEKLVVILSFSCVVISCGSNDSNPVKEDRKEEAKEVEE